MTRTDPLETTPWRGVATPAVFSDLSAEIEALSAGCGVFPRPADALRMAGEDRHRFLNSQITADVKTLGAGSGVYAFLPTQKGRAEADLVVLATDDAFWIELPPSTAGAIRAQLEKYVIVDRVEIEPLERRILSLAGPRATEILGGLVAGDLPAATRDHREIEVGGVEARVVCDPGFAEDEAAFSIWLRPDAVEAVESALVEADAVLVGHRAWDVRRVEAGRPLWGVDFGVENFPQETGLEDEAVSYTKGCYLGQEVIARIHYRGGVQRRLRGLRFEAAVDSGEVESGDALLFEGKAVGTVGSVVRSAHLGTIGLAVVHDKAEPGSTVTIADPEGGVERGVATVVELPFDS